MHRVVCSPCNAKIKPVIASWGGIFGRLRALFAVSSRIPVSLSPFSRESGARSRIKSARFYWNSLPSFSPPPPPPALSRPREIAPALIAESFIRTQPRFLLFGFAPGRDARKPSANLFACGSSAEDNGPKCGLPPRSRSCRMLTASSTQWIWVGFVLKCTLPLKLRLKGRNKLRRCSCRLAYGCLPGRGKGRKGDVSWKYLAFFSTPCPIFSPCSIMNITFDNDPVVSKWNGTSIATR